MNLPRSRQSSRSRVLYLALLLVPAVPGACADSAIGPEAADTNPPGSQVAVLVVSGADQAGSEGSLLPEPIVVRVTREDGTPAADAPVRFSVIHGEGVVGREVSWTPHRTLDVRTDAQGLAQAKWRLGSSPDHILKVSIPWESTGTPTSYTGSSAYVFAGMEARISIEWTKGQEFRAADRVIPHDGRILETPDFLTFSDASSDDAKVVFAALAEESLHEILMAYGLSSPADLGIDTTDSSTKLRIYSNRTFQYDTLAYSFRFGFVAGGEDSGVYGSDAELRQVVKHELAHVFAMLFATVGSDVHGFWLPDVWFAEGLAEHTAGGSREPIRTLQDVNAWRADPDHLDPIHIRAWADFPSAVLERSNGFEYYPMFDLAVRYLLDEAGLGKTYGDVRSMCEQIRAGDSFSHAFEANMGISVDDFEERFYGLIASYLGG